MVCALDSGSSGPGSRPGRGHCVVFMGNTLNSHSASLHPGGNPAMDLHPIQGGVEIFLVASCYENRDKLRPGEPHGSYADFTYLLYGFRLVILLVFLYCTQSL